MSGVDPNEWQKHVNLLVSFRHGKANYQEVPDKHKGDFGIEGFSPDDEVCYQAYSPDEPISTEERYDKQRTKITTDIKKFIDNEVELQKLFGQTVIRRWILVVPKFDSAKLVQHAEKKAGEVRSKNLEYVAEDFKIIIETENQFSEEKHKLLNSGLLDLEIELEEVYDKNIQDWSDENDGLVKVVDGKLKMLKTEFSGKEIIELRNFFIKKSIVGKNVLGGLKNEYPIFWEKLHKVKKHREENLILETKLQINNSQETLITEIDKMEKVFKETIPSLSSLTANQLGYEAVSDWMIRCPLDFKEAQ